MTTKKVNLANVKKSLTRNEMKAIMAGSGGGPCADQGFACDTNKDINCCSGYICAGNVCRIRTR